MTGNCEIELKGGSHVFVPTATDDAEPTDVAEVSGAAGAFQEVFGRTALKQLLIAYWKDESTVSLRRNLGAEHLDLEATWR